MSHYPLTLAVELPILTLISHLSPYRALCVKPEEAIMRNGLGPHSLLLALLIDWQDRQVQHSLPLPDEPFLAQDPLWAVQRRH